MKRKTETQEKRREEKNTHNKRKGQTQTTEEERRRKTGESNRQGRAKYTTRGGENEGRNAREARDRPEEEGDRLQAEM